MANLGARVRESLLPQGHLTMSGRHFGCHKSEVGRESATGVQCFQAREEMNRSDVTKKQPAQKVNNVEVEKF